MEYILSEAPVSTPMMLALGAGIHPRLGFIYYGGILGALEALNPFGGEGEGGGRGGGGEGGGRGV